MKSTYKSRCLLAQYNTSYPLVPEHWHPYRSAAPLHYGSEASIYLHVPFCPQLCTFCEYTRMATPEGELQSHYVRTLLKELHEFGAQHQHLRLEGFDIGGGTPTALSPKLLGELVQGYQDFLLNRNTATDFEPSIESTFQTATEEKLQIIGQGGIKRLSLGVQSSSTELLRNHARRLEQEDVMQRVLHAAHAAGIHKVNLDFMYGLPGQSAESIIEDLELVRTLAPEQVPLYELRTNMIHLPATTAEHRARAYQTWYSGLQELGYKAPFGRNTFSLKPADEGCSSYLRKRMFNGTPYRGFGVSAQSMGINGVSYNSGKSMHGEALRRCVAAQNYSPQDIYHLPPAELAAKYIAVAGYSGEFSLSIASRILNSNAAEYYAEAIQFCLDHELLEARPDNILRITREGFKHIGAVFSLFYSPSSKTTQI